MTYCDIGCRGKAALDVRLEGETLWLNLNQMAGLFERYKSVISRHLLKVFKSGELDRNSVVAFFATGHENELHNG